MVQEPTTGRGLNLTKMLSDQLLWEPFKDVSWPVLIVIIFSVAILSGDKNTCRMTKNRSSTPEVGVTYVGSFAPVQKHAEKTQRLHSHRVTFQLRIDSTLFPHQFCTTGTRQ